jgi:hypothetical protein
VLTDHQFGWFSMLKNSPDSFNLAFSQTGKILDTEESQSQNPGPRSTPVPEFPKNPDGGAVKAAVLNHWDKV